jgi:phenylacetate-CoA ligase
MKDSLISGYHRLPGPARSAVASLRGLYLGSWRYGGDAESLVAEAAERESWNPERWRSWQQERLSEVLHRAATRVPHYRRAWEERRRRGDRSSWDRLENWPVLSKETVRQAPLEFVAEDRDPRRMYHEHTSGTTGKPLHIWQSKDTVRRWFALFEARVRRWNGVSRSDRWAMVGGQLVVPVGRTRPPFWVRNYPMHQLYLSSYHLAPSNFADYFDAMRRFGTVYMLGYASSMMALAQGSLELGIEAPKLRVAISNAEPLSPVQRQRIGAAFRCPVRDTYGMAEIACGASECSAGSLHVWPDAGWIEVLQDEEDSAGAAGESGRLVCTGFINADMPLVRYAVGDRGALAPAGPPCACGRPLPRLERIEGRCDDVLVTPEGRLVGRLDPVFKADLPIREAQIVQEALDRIRLKVVPAQGLDPADLRIVRQRLLDRLGSSVEVVVEIVEAIPRGAGGKFRSVVSLLPRGTDSPAPEPAPAEASPV